MYEDLKRYPERTAGDGAALPDDAWRLRLSLARPLPGSVDAPSDLRASHVRTLGPPAERRTFENPAAGISGYEPGAGATKQEKAKAKAKRGGQGGSEAPPPPQQQQHAEEAAAPRRLRRIRPGELSSFRSKTVRIAEVPAVAAAAAARATLPPDPKGSPGGGLASLETDRARVPGMPLWVAEPGRRNAVFVSRTGRVESFGDTGGARIELSRLMPSVGAWDPNGSTELLARGGPKALDLEARAPPGFALSTALGTATRGPLQGGAGQASAHQPDGSSQTGGGASGAATTSQASVGGKELGGHDSDDDSVDEEVKEARAARRKALQARRVAEESAAMPSVLGDWLVRHRIESLGQMLASDFGITHTSDLLVASATAMDDMTYFVRKPMRPRFRAMVAEIKAKAALEEEAENARGGAAAAIKLRAQAATPDTLESPAKDHGRHRQGDARRHHRHHHHHHHNHNHHHHHHHHHHRRKRDIIGGPGLADAGYDKKGDGKEYSDSDWSSSGWSSSGSTSGFDDSESSDGDGDGGGGGGSSGGGGGGSGDGSDNRKAVALFGAAGNGFIGLARQPRHTPSTASAPTSAAGSLVGNLVKSTAAGGSAAPASAPGHPSIKGGSRGGAGSPGATHGRSGPANGDGPTAAAAAAAAAAVDAAAAPSRRGPVAVALPQGLPEPLSPGKPGALDARLDARGAAVGPGPLGGRQRSSRCCGGGPQSLRRAGRASRVGQGGSELGSIAAATVGTSILAEADAAAAGRLLFMSTPAAIASQRSAAMQASLDRHLLRGDPSGQAPGGDGGGGPLPSGVRVPAPGGAAAAFASSVKRIDFLGRSKPGTQCEYEPGANQTFGALAKKALAGGASGTFIRRPRPPLFVAQTAADLAYGAKLPSPNEERRKRYHEDYGIGFSAYPATHGNHDNGGLGFGYGYPDSSGGGGFDSTVDSLGVGLGGGETGLFVSSHRAFPDDHERPRSRGSDGDNGGDDVGDDDGGGGGSGNGRRVGNRQSEAASGDYR